MFGSRTPDAPFTNRDIVPSSGLRHGVFLFVKDNTRNANHAQATAPISTMNNLDCVLEKKTKFYVDENSTPLMGPGPTTPRSHAECYSGHFTNKDYLNHHRD